MRSDEYAPTAHGSAAALLRAVTAISADLDLHSVLVRIVRSATELTAASYGAIGVVSADGSMVEFVTTGLDLAGQTAVGAHPSGLGILRLLIDQPEVVRMVDLKTHPMAFGFPPGHPVMSSLLGVPIRVRGTVYGNLYLTEKAEGAAFTEHDEELVRALAAASGLVIDNARAYGLSERRRRWLEASAELLDLLQPPIDLTRALQLIASTARSVSGAAVAAVIGLPVAGAATLVATSGPAQRLDPSLLNAIAASSAQRGESVAVFEVRAGDDVAVVIPLRAHLAAKGALVALYDGRYRPDRVEELGLLASFADQAALALDRREALLQREKLALLADRDRIAGDLHDVVIQRLFAAGLHLQAALLSSDPEALGAGAQQAIDELDRTIGDIRDTIFDLEGRSAGSLRSDIGELVGEYVAILGFTPAVTISGPVESVTPSGLRDDVLAVLREALSNLARHAGAAGADVEVAVGATELRVCVRDDGVGLPVERRESGLRSARRRATHRGGSFEISRCDPRGTTLAWSVPLR